MHTVIRLDQGVLEVSLRDADTDVQEGRWRAAIAPAIVLLRYIGDGTLCIPHRPTDLGG
ncbi:MAG TPA: hypothetical protein VG410_08710 [Solirubrobacteraceae bacterium]|jgi:hypothetical protein|nr:hypothetical protein [Solirubrobacteraceae bacterium]